MNQSAICFYVYVLFRDDCFFSFKMKVNSLYLGDGIAESENLKSNLLETDTTSNRTNPGDVKIEDRASGSRQVEI